MAELNIVGFDELVDMSNATPAASELNDLLVKLAQVCEAQPAVASTRARTALRTPSRIETFADGFQPYLSEVDNDAAARVLLTMISVAPGAQSLWRLGLAALREAVATSLLVDYARASLKFGAPSGWMLLRLIRLVFEAKPSADTALSDLLDRLVRLFRDHVEIDENQHLWEARLSRCLRDSDDALDRYWNFYKGAQTSDEMRNTALTEMVEVLTSHESWASRPDIVIAAHQAGVPSFALSRIVDYLERVAAPNRLDNIETVERLTKQGLFLAIDSISAALDVLFDRLQARPEYTPNDTLVMVGTSLAAGGMERIFTMTYNAVKSSRKFERVCAVFNDLGAPERLFYMPLLDATRDELIVLSPKDVADPALALLPRHIGGRIQNLLDVIGTEKPSVIHAWNDLPGLMAVIAGLIAGVPKIIVHIHHMRATNLSNDYWLVQHFPAAFRRLMSRPQVVAVYVAEAAARDYADWWGIERSDRMISLHNGFSFATPPETMRDQMRAQFGIADDETVVGTVFRFDKVKRPLLWVEAAAELVRRRERVRFVMVGGGTLWEAAKARADELGVGDRFIFTGQVTNVADHLMAMDVFLLTSASEGLPNSLVEAQFCGVPVLTVDVGGAKETMIEGRTGATIASATPSSIATALDEAIASGLTRQRRRDEVMAHAVAAFSMDSYLARLMAIYATSGAPRGLRSDLIEH